MRIEREFLGWDRTPLETGVQWLVARAKRLGPSLDLTGLAVCLPSARAGRVLLNLLLHEAERGGGVLLPPTMFTPGTLQRTLLEASRPLEMGPSAGPLVRRLAWRAALGELPAELRSALGASRNGEDTEPLLLASLVEHSHARLVSMMVTFGEAWKVGAGVHGGSLEPRLGALARAEEVYSTTLMRAGVSDPDLWLARSANSDGPLRLRPVAFERLTMLGVADVPPSLGALLRRSASGLDVSVLVCAPESRATSFDEVGGLVAEAWVEGTIDFGSATLRVVDTATELVHAALGVLGTLPRGTTSDDVVLGVTDRAMEAPLVRAARHCGVRVRLSSGAGVASTPIGLLLTQIRELLQESNFRSWGTLLRHPWFHAAMSGAVPLDRLDRYVLEHLPEKLTTELVQDADSEELRALLASTSDVLGDLSPLKDGQGEPRKLSAWAKAIGDFLERIVPTGENGAEADADEDSASDAVFAAVAQMEELASFGSLDATVLAASAVSVLLTLLEDKAIPPLEVEDAVEAVGWLELATDPARHVVVVGLNDGMVPSREVPDPLLPLPVLRAIGVDVGDARVARDAYLLSLIGASRRSLSILLSRHGEEGDPLLPSRLLFRVDDQAMIARAQLWVPQKNAAKVALAVPPTRSCASISKFKPLVIARHGVLERWPVTAFRDYLASPYLFYLRYIARVQEVESATMEMLPNRFGSLVHEVLRDFARSDARGATNENDIRNVVRRSLEHRVATLFGEHPSVPVWLQSQQALARLDGFARWQASRSRDGWSIVESEWSPGKDGVSFDWSGGSVRLTGRIDRIDRHPIRGFALIDYKTADTAAEPEKTHRSKGEWKDLQLPLYRHLAKSVTAESGAEDSPTLGYLNLAADGEASLVAAEWDGAELQEADDAARSVIARVFAGELGDAGTMPPANKTYSALAGLGHLGEMGEDDEEEEA